MRNTVLKKLIPYVQTCTYIENIIYEIMPQLIYKNKCKKDNILKKWSLKQIYIYHMGGYL